MIRISTSSGLERRRCARVPNLTLRREDGRVVAESVAVADSTLRRLRGLLGQARPASGHGVLLRPAWSIHTAFMRFPIDVVFLDADQVVIKIVPEPDAVQDRVLPRRARGRRAARRRMRAARARARRPRRLGRRAPADEAPQRGVGDRTTRASGAAPSCSRAATSATSSSSGSCSTARGSRSSRACRRGRGRRGRRRGRPTSSSSTPDAVGEGPSARERHAGAPARGDRRARRRAARRHAPGGHADLREVGRDGRRRRRDRGCTRAKAV